MSIWFLNYALNSVWCLIQQFYFGTNLLLIKFVYILCALFCGLCCSILQMAPRRTSAQHANKRKRMDVSLFLFTQHFEWYTQHFMKAPIIQERFMDLADLKDYFIPSCLAERGWDRLLSDLPEVCDPLISEFYANAIQWDDVIDCWVRGHEFTIEVEDIDEILGFEDVEHDFTHFKDRMLSVETIQSHIGGVRKGWCLNTTAFPPDLRCLTYIMVFNLYPVRKMTTINNARAIFLMELQENTYIDISAHLFTILANETRATSRPKLILPSLIMRVLLKKVWRLPKTSTFCLHLLLSML